MTHKEKAKELVNKFKFDCRIEYECRPLSVKQISKQCALIAVNEVIESNKNMAYSIALNDDQLRAMTSDSFNRYWKQVKREIKKL